MLLLHPPGTRQNGQFLHCDSDPKPISYLRLPGEVLPEGVGGLDPRLLFDPDRNSAPCELPREEDVRLPTAGATKGKFPTVSPPELDETVIVGVDCVVASLVDDMRLAYTAAITSVLPNIIAGIGKIEFLPRRVSVELLNRAPANR